MSAFVIVDGRGGTIITMHDRQECLRCRYLTMSAIGYCIICQAQLALIEETVTPEMSDWDTVQDWRSRINSFHELNIKTKSKNGIVVETN